MPELLRLEEVSLHYGSLRAVDAVSLTVHEGERHALIGPNGAGKSSLLAVIAGTVKSTSGRIIVDGRDVTRAREHSRARFGVVKTFQHSSVFLGMSVLDNVELAVQRACGMGHRAFRPLDRARGVWDRARQCLETVHLEHRERELASALSHGERRQLEVALTLAVEPRLLLLDEPTAGMSAAESASFVRLIESLPREVTVLLIEHDLDLVFRLAEQISVMHVGALIASGTPDEVRGSQAVQDAYLGGARTESLFEEEPS
jgi:branched-chain amino acid transport system ATP-binding protein